jgi:hypothetical protein
MVEITCVTDVPVADIPVGVQIPVGAASRLQQLPHVAGPPGPSQSQHLHIQCYKFSAGK